MWRAPMLDACFARSPDSSPFGKRTAELRCRVDEETEELLTRRAREEGMSLGEYIGLRLMIEAHGLERVQSVYADRLIRIAGIGKQSA